MQQTSGILDVAIGLISIYLLLSLICSALIESLEKWIFKYRGKKLCEGLLELFGGGSGGLAFLNDFYKNPLIYSLYKGDVEITGNQSGIKAQNNLPSYIDPNTFSLALISQLLNGQEVNNQSLKTALLKDRIPENLKSSLLVLIGAAGNDLNQAVSNIESWYSAMGDRVGGWYKRHTQMMAFLMACSLTLIGNFDTLNIAKSLMLNQNLRAELIAEAAEYQTPALDCKSSVIDPEKCYQNKVKQLDKLQDIGLPIGWKNAAELPDLCQLNSAAAIATWMEKLLGLFMTAIAISLGAPFWFDTLNKFMNIRATIKPQKAKPQTQEK